MSFKNLAVFFLYLISFQLFSQENLLTSFTIRPNLSKNANAVVRSSHVQIDLKSSSEMHILEKTIVTVLNKEGDDAINTYVHYDNNVNIKDLEVLVYNDFGSEIKKIKKKDFKDVSAVDGGTLYSDSRVKYLDYTPIGYPYTMVFTSEVVSTTTAFIQSFMPVNNYFLSVEKSSYQINFPTDLTIRSKEKNFLDFDLEKEELDGSISYNVKNIEAIKPESYAPAFFNMAPKILVTSNQFNLEGVQSHVENWNDFGKWMYHDLIKTTHDLPASTITMIQELVKDEPDDIAKAKKIYKYVQDKVRYISVQVGIGGWKPFNASEVDRLGYGDCKALTNYTMTLLKAVGIESNYTVVYAGDSQRDLEKDFAAMQGNHAILNIPTAQDDIWLECTSQKLPFGFIGDFTDDRDVLVISPDGGEIKHTKKYKVEDNLQTIKGNYSISNDGTLEANAIINSKGIQYDDKYWVETETERDLDKYYKKRWRYINDMSINNMAIENNKKDIEFIEHVDFKAANYTKVIGNRMLLTINALNRNIHVPDRYRNRKFPLKVNRGFKDIDEVEVALPSEYKVEALPKSVLIENKFGYYKTEILVKDESKLVYKREFKINDGEFPKEDYSGFRDFYKTVLKQDNAKIALIKK
ncbi:DUF3857 domain-containing protein [Algibacter amylolyticus]|uniref:DUF3857 domain-containing protein n=1 Tax=Algibacter amylolyticus TaxID=1608400 RepID=A0A5M7B9R3_9FLAO|nr:DUF3857 domain-containing protein [Algibacter amylolyticus]KAA5826316.1 DUF3857 domain-containing protein [Algibacter amylolyticus]MBB5268519.1 transglutaminase-like putative cysteine protease [Algibacter amylolyticus]TSJ80354.1 DUF3857 domain-containing protein [Algibacter amylolyticus]